jgi:hypothetical protein
MFGKYRNGVLLSILIFFAAAVFGSETLPRDQGGPLRDAVQHPKLEFLNDWLQFPAHKVEKPLEFLDAKVIEMHKKTAKHTFFDNFFSPKDTLQEPLETATEPVQHESHTTPLQFISGFFKRDNLQHESLVPHDVESPSEVADVLATSGSPVQNPPEIELPAPAQPAEPSPKPLGGKQTSIRAGKAAKKGANTNSKDQHIDIHKEHTIVNPHPELGSPREGSDIGVQHRTSLLRCVNQSTCIVPALQLEKKLKIYLCKHRSNHGIRFYYLAREGLLLHPNVELLEEADIAAADFIFYLPGSTPWHKTECTNPEYQPRLIVLDEYDLHQLVRPTITPEEYVLHYGDKNSPWYFMYFKRSFVRRLNGVFQGYPHFHQPDLYPLTYAVAEVYISPEFTAKRDIEVMCTLRGSKSMTTRLRAQQWVAAYGESRGITNNMVTAQVGV